jgi:hypothetical protein
MMDEKRYSKTGRTGEIGTVEVESLGLCFSVAESKDANESRAVQISEQESQ